MRSLFREDRVAQAEIARRMGRHKRWVWRRLMLVEALDLEVQADVRLGLIAARAAVAVSRLPRGNQQAASAVVIRRGLTVRQTGQLVEELLAEAEVRFTTGKTAIVQAFSYVLVVSKRRYVGLHERNDVHA